MADYIYLCLRCGSIVLPSGIRNGTTHTPILVRLNPSIKSQCSSIFKILSQECIEPAIPDNNEQIQSILQNRSQVSLSSISTSTSTSTSTSPTTNMQIQPSSQLQLVQSISCYVSRSHDDQTRPDMQDSPAFRIPWILQFTSSQISLLQLSSSSPTDQAEISSAENSPLDSSLPDTFNLSITSSAPSHLDGPDTAWIANFLERREEERFLFDKEESLKRRNTLPSRVKSLGKSVAHPVVKMMRSRSFEPRLEGLQSEGGDKSPVRTNSAAQTQTRVRVLSRRPTVGERVRSGVEKGRRGLVGWKGKVKISSPVKWVSFKMQRCWFEHGRNVEGRWGRKDSVRDESENLGWR